MYFNDRRASPDQPIALREGDVLEWPGIEVSEQRISKDIYETLHRDWIDSIRRSNDTPNDRR